MKVKHKGTLWFTLRKPPPRINLGHLGEGGFLWRGAFLTRIPLIHLFTTNRHSLANAYKPWGCRRRSAARDYYLNRDNDKPSRPRDETLQLQFTWKSTHVLRDPPVLCFYPFRASRPNRRTPCFDPSKKQGGFFKDMGWWEGIELYFPQ